MTKTDIQEVLGGNVRRFRMERHMTQEQLAETAGISTSFCTNIERGKKRPGLAVLISLAKALSVSVDALLLDSPEDPVELSARNVAAMIRCMTPEDAQRAEHVFLVLVQEGII